MTGEDVVALRARLRVSAKMLAQVLDVTPETVSRWENEHTLLSTVHALAFEALEKRVEHGWCCPQCPNDFVPDCKLPPNAEPGCRRHGERVAMVRCTGLYVR